ncbi:non-specific lipid-transfer protein 1-like [Impatiens glandulifera]|uniref:non-specific lipid-transfer protein 1-like n=1 Tax=Impatiens glandulifera TaxID=253017 RepID=UPI001FB15957|nr:non-specific lipid-transfer protein 1-like [Impatiens glandulifera]
MKMMMKEVTTFIVLLAVVLLLQQLPDGEAVITCGQVNAALAPCLPFLTSSGAGTPVPKCCNGIRAARSLMRTKLERQTVCNCFKIASQRFKSISDRVAASLPKKCGVSIGIPISRSVDCSRVG